MAPHRVSVLTAAYRPVPEYLAAAYQSLASQQMPAGWDWQWVVQEDGQSGEVAALLPDDPRISAGSGRRGGECVTRTMCLTRADGELVKVLDADDILTPGALAREIAVLTEHADVGWTTARALDLHPDGRTQGSPLDPPAGRLARGYVFARWQANDHVPPVHPATLCMRRELAVALGGWMALPASCDTGLLMAADAVSDGYFIAETGMLYRKWPGQISSQPAHDDPAERAARHLLIEQRAQALRATWGASTFRWSRADARERIRQLPSGSLTSSSV